MVKIFISYKYADSNVKPLPGHPWCTQVRHYVDYIQDYVIRDHINKGEQDGEDLSHFKNETIKSKLRAKIYDSSVTLVLISPEMKDKRMLERDQWIPWEISYSLRESMRNGRTSRTNGMLAVVLPDRRGAYEYFIEEHNCPYCDSTLYKTDTLFQILSANMFNRKTPVFSSCPCHVGQKPQVGYVSYIHVVKWDDFIKSPNEYIAIAQEIRDRKLEYQIVKQVG